MQECEKEDPGPRPVPSVLWGLPSAVSVIQEGDANAVSMSFARDYQDLAERQFLMEKNSSLSGLLCIKTLELDIANEMIKECENRIRVLEDQNSLLSADLRRYTERDQVQEFLTRKLWPPVERTVQGYESWDSSPEILRSGMALSTTSSPITLSQVLRGLGFQCSGSDVRRLAAVVHEAFVREYGHPPRPKVYYDNSGQAERLSCFTEDDRDFLERVLMNTPLLQKRPQTFVAS